MVGSIPRTLFLAVLLVSQAKKCFGATSDNCLQTCLSVKYADEFIDCLVGQCSLHELQDDETMNSIEKYLETMDTRTQDADTDQLNDEIIDTKDGDISNAKKRAHEFTNDKFAKRFGRYSRQGLSKYLLRKTRLLPAGYVRIGRSNEGSGDKRALPAGYVRIGKALPAGYVRIGKALPAGYVRIGKALPAGYVRIGKALPAGYVRIGKALPAGYVRIGKALPAGYVRIGKALPAGYVRIGKALPPGYVRIGRALPAGYVRIGKALPAGYVRIGKALPPGYVRIGKRNTKTVNSIKASS